MRYIFEKPLKEAIIIKRNNQFTIDVEINGEIVRCHCPTTGRIGDLELSGIACLISENNNLKRKLKYTVEAVSCDELEKMEKKWIGINQILSNKLVEYFISNNLLNDMIGKGKDIKREVKLGLSKLDFLVGNTYIEVKTPLTTLNVEYGKHVRTKPLTPFSSTERFTKHIKELANSLNKNERAILLTVNQYETAKEKERQRSTNYEEVKSAVEYAIDKGVEMWHMEMEFLKDGVRLVSCTNKTARNQEE